MRKGRHARFRFLPSQFGIQLIDIHLKDDQIRLSLEVAIENEL